MPFMVHVSRPYSGPDDTSRFPAVDLAGAHGLVRALLVGLVRQDRRTRWIQSGRAFKVTQGIFIGTLIEAIETGKAVHRADYSEHVTAQSVPATSDLRSYLDSVGRCYVQQCNADLENVRKAKTAVLVSMKDCRPCKGTGKQARTESRLVWSATPWQPYGTRTESRTIHENCGHCKGHGKV